MIEAVEPGASYPRGQRSSVAVGWSETYLGGLLEPGHRLLSMNSYHAVGSQGNTSGSG